MIDHAATKIQAVFRGYQARKAFWKKRVILGNQKLHLVSLCVKIFLCFNYYYTIFFLIDILLFDQLHAGAQTVTDSNYCEKDSHCI